LMAGQRRAVVTRIGFGLGHVGTAAARVARPRGLGGMFPGVAIALVELAESYPGL